MRILAILLLLAMFGCASSTPERAGLPEPAASRFPFPETLVFADYGDVQRPINGVRAPRYPFAERARGVEAAFFSAFVLDTAGRIEVRSVTFLGDAPEAFAKSVCEYLAQARYAPVRQDGLARRALVVMDFAFGLNGGRLENRTFDPAPIREYLRQKGVVAATAELESQPHCPRG